MISNQHKQRSVARMKRSVIRESTGIFPGAGTAGLPPGSAPGPELAVRPRQFATLIHAGLTIEECLNALIEQTESTRSRSVLAGVRTRVLEGQSLSRGLAQFPESFPA